MRDPSLRASDADREAVASQLQRHMADGRLTLDELHERLEKVYAARTYRDLDDVVRDLPRAWEVAPVGVPQPYLSRWRARRAERWTRGWYRYGIINIGCWGLWGFFVVVSGGHHTDDFWPIFVTVPWGTLRLARSPTVRARRRPPEITA